MLTTVSQNSNIMNLMFYVSSLKRRTTNINRILIPQQFSSEIRFYLVRNTFSLISPLGAHVMWAPRAGDLCGAVGFLLGSIFLQIDLRDKTYYGIYGPHFYDTVTKGHQSYLYSWFSSLL